MSTTAPTRESASIVKLRTAQPVHPNNPGIPFDPDPVAGVRVNLSAVERRTATLSGRRTVKKDWQAAWLVKALQCIDLTTLSGDDTEGRVRRLCAKARRPVREDILEGLGLGGRNITVGAVCVYHRFVATANTRTLPEALPATAERLRAAWPEGPAGGTGARPDDGASA